MAAGLQAAAGKKKLIQERNELIFSDVSSFEKFFTGQKLHILCAIKVLKPDSIYNLAKMVERDFANVSRDCTALEQKGFLVLRDVGDTRQSKAPRLAFDYDVIQIHLPTKVTYSHHLAA